MSEAAEPLFTSARRQSIRRALKRWYRANGRPLPWRLTSDAYRIWISEIMLQQTTVAAVIPYFERFTAAFPTVHELAAAEEADVLREWEGLGYYSRARNLRKAARVVVDKHGGELPANVAELESLPGIGRYTAGAIASFAFDLPAPIVEANTERLYARLIAYDQTLQNAAGKRTLWRVAEELVPRKNAGDFNQAVMELGSQVCRIVEPDCPNCPIKTSCEAFATGQVAAIPKAKSRPKVTERTEIALVGLEGGDCLIRQRGGDERWAGLWDFPRVDVSDLDWLPAIRGDRQPVLPGVFEPVDAAASEQFGQPVRVTTWLTEFVFGVTRYRIRLICLAATMKSRDIAAALGCEWQPTASLVDLPLTRPARRIAELLVD